MAQGAGSGGGKKRVRSAPANGHHGLARFVSLQDFRPVRGGTRVYARFEGLDPWVAEFKVGNDSGFPNRIVQIRDRKDVLYPHARPAASGGGSGSTAHDASGTRGVAFGVGPGGTIEPEQAEKLLDAAYDREIELKHPSLEVPREIGRIQWPTVRMLQDPGIRIPVVYRLDEKRPSDPDAEPEQSGASGAPEILRFAVVEEGASASAKGGERVVDRKHYSVRKGEAFSIAYKVSENADQVSLDPLGTLEDKEGEVRISPPPEETTTYTLVASRGSAQSVCHFSVEPREGRFLDLTREHALFKEEVPLAESEYAELKLEIQVKANGTLELGAVEGSDEEWLKRLGEQLKKDCEELVQLLNPTGFIIHFNSFHFEGFQPEVTRTKEGWEVKCKLVGQFHKPELEVEGTAILFSTEHEDGKILPRGPKAEFAMIKQLSVVPDFELVKGKAMCKDLGLSAEGKLIVEPHWSAIARWLISEAGMDAALTVGFFILAVAPVVELIISCMMTEEWRRMRASVPDFAERYAQGYMDALDGKAEAGDPAYHRAWEDGWKKSHEAEQKCGSWTAYMDWLQQNRSKVEANVQRQALDLARRTAWEQYNSTKRNWKEQWGAWLWIFPDDPVKVDRYALFHSFADPDGPERFQCGRW